MLSVQRLTVTRSGREVLAPTTITWEAPQICALLGPNGAGKSTLLRAISGDPTGATGQITVAGIPIHRLRGARRAQALTYHPQHIQPGFGYTLREILSLTPGSHAGRGRVIDALELTPLLDRSVLDLSGGEQQRAFLARTLAQESPVLLLDEPFAALDPRHTHTLCALLRSAVHRGALILVAIHDLRLAASLSDRLLLLHEGHLIADGAPEIVLTPDNLHHVYGVSKDYLTQA